MAKIMPEYPIQLNLSEEAHKALTKLQKATGNSSKTRVFHLAMSTLSWLIEELQAGHKILVLKNPAEPPNLHSITFKVKKVRSGSK